MGYTDKELRDATQIAYMDLSHGYNYLVEIKNEKPPFSIRQIINSTKEEMIQKNLEDKIKKGDISIDLDSWKITEIHDKNDENGFYGCIIETSNNEAIVAFRGSEEPSINNQLQFDWIDADIGLLNSTETLQQTEVNLFLSDIKNKGLLDKYTYVASTGHSLGGNLSDYFTIQAANELSDKMKQSVNFDGPGFSKEFLESNKINIESVSGIMKHYQWSAVGNLLFPVPGVEFVTSDIKNYSETSKYLQDERKEYSYYLIARHDTRSLKYDEHGNLVNGKMDNLAWFMGKISKLIDRMPSAIGNSMKKDLKYFLLLGEEIKSLLVVDKKLTTLGKEMVAAAAIAVLSNPIGTLKIAAKVIVTAVAVVLASVGLECLIEYIESIAEKVGELVAEAKKMVAKKFEEFKEALKKEVSKVKDLAKYAITLITNKAARDKLVDEAAGKIRDYSAGILEELKKAYSLIISEEFFDMRIWNKKYLQEKWYGRLLLSPIQAVAFRLAGSVLDAGIGFINKVMRIFEEVQELDDNFAKFLNTKADELNAVAELLD
ncbi:Mbeg1-like protein [Anaerocolumna sp. AGMB13020]|uniref:Mbeg1-like protein n=1 Tax=Anaerocolumna sp. AGMB13020 TaxID=3081750 RepID=UPI002954360D|nr:Mbeg1-like protein [Anaerocolumna sp. AGMB13020]WOO35551.1 Mbeg1-like protein [Anaerocolumna sp. AGMB13020]